MQPECSQNLMDCEAVIRKQWATPALHRACSRKTGPARALREFHYVPIMHNVSVNISQAPLLDSDRVMSGQSSPLSQHLVSFVGSEAYFGSNFQLPPGAGLHQALAGRCSKDADYFNSSS
ncbi:unnamed protein product [Polarella glacialis]|uniref:Uncharacterized protein n=1 Tax=Polarella glacialis TaxID=89957 RepID=A0A813LKP4_POLGL|nr:unnamed protein product [Polarella glacialis]